MFDGFVNFSAIQTGEDLLDLVPETMDASLTIRCASKGEASDFFINKAKILEAIRMKKCTVASVSGQLSGSLRHYLDDGKPDYILWLKKEASQGDDFPWLYLVLQGKY